MSRISSHIIYLALLAMGMFSSMGNAQSLQEFKDADNEEGCKSIPYSSQRQNCSSYGSDVENWCKNQQRSCEQLNPEGLLRKIEQMTGKLKSLEEEKAKATTDNDKRALQEESDRINKILEETKKKIDDDKYEMKKRLDVGEHCRDYRGKVQLEFLEATRKASNETDPAIKPIAESLIAKWKAGMEKHIPEFQKTSDDVEACKKLLN